MELRELMLPEVILAVSSMLMAAWLESRRLLGAEVIVLAAATYGMSGAMSHAPHMVLAWSCLALWALAYFSKWKSDDSDVPYPWLVMRR